MSARNPLAFILLLALVLLAMSAGTAGADPAAKVAFHGIRTVGVSDEDIPRLHLAVESVLAARYGDGLLHNSTVVTACDRDLQCHCAQARKNRSQQAIYGHVGQIGETYSFELVVTDAQSCTVENSVFFAETLTFATATQSLRRLTQKMMTPPASLSEVAVKSSQDIAAVPARVRVITRKEIEELGITRLADLLQLVPGFEAYEANAYTSFTYLALPETILFMIDGIPLTNPFHNFRRFGQDLEISLNHIERVEIIQGPGSVLWGANALLGIVNLVTTGVERQGTHAVAQTRAGTFGTQEVHARAEHNQRDLHVQASATFRRYRGPSWFAEDAPIAYVALPESVEPLYGGTGFTDNRFDTYFDLSANARLYKRLELRLQHYEDKNFYEISTFGSLLDPGEGGSFQKSHRLYQIAWKDTLGYGWGYALTGSRYESRSYENLVIHARHPDGHPDGLRALQGNPAEPTINYLGEARLSHTFSGAQIKNRALAGLATLYQSFPDNFATVLGIRERPVAETLDFEANTLHTVAAFAQDDIEVGSHVILSGGLRFEERIGGSSVLSNHLAALMRSRYLNGKLIYSEGFRPAAANALYSTTGTEGNPNLSPEVSADLAAELTLNLADHAAIRLGGSRTVLSGLVERTEVGVSPGFFNRYTNGGRIEVLAAYADARAQISPFLSSFGSYTFKKVDGEILEGSIAIPVSAHTMTGGFVLRPLDGVVTHAWAVLASPLEIFERTGAGNRVRRLPVSVQSNMGATFLRVYRGLDLDLTVRNPIGSRRYAPLKLSGGPTTVDVSSASEVLLTLRWAQ